MGLGANLGAAEAAIAGALQALGALRETRLVRASSLYRTAPWQARGPDYVNAVAELATLLSPSELLTELHGIEAAHGRERSYRNAPRTLDLDLLLHGAARVRTPELTLPHPRLHERAFVLIPLAEIAPDLEVPDRGLVRDLLGRLGDQRVDRLLP